MTTKKGPFTKRISEEVRMDIGLRDFLTLELGLQLPSGYPRKWILAGVVYVNSVRTRAPQFILRKGMLLEVFVPERDIASIREKVVDQIRNREFQIDKDSIVYEDDCIVVINKPSGLPTQPSVDRTRANLFDLVKQFRKGEYVGLHHRLDKETSGLVLFTKVETANKWVSDLFSKHLIQKTYLAVCEASAKAIAQFSKRKWEYESYVKKEKLGSKSSIMRSVRSGGDFAKTEFRWLEKLEDSIVLIEAKPQTGRTHQIRLHLSDQKMPICGDKLYGASFGMNESSPRFSRVMLHARHLDFFHPVQNRQLKITCPLPEDFRAWQIEY